MGIFLASVSLFLEIYIKINQVFILDYEPFYLNRQFFKNLSSYVEGNI